MHTRVLKVYYRKDEWDNGRLACMQSGNTDVLLCDVATAIVESVMKCDAREIAGGTCLQTLSCAAFETWQ